MKDTRSTRGHVDTLDSLDAFAPEREARARGDGFELHDEIRPAPSAPSTPSPDDMLLPWHDESAEAMRRAAFAEWRNRLFKLSFAGALVAAVLFLIPVVQSGQITAWLRSIEGIVQQAPASEATVRSVPDVPAEPDAGAPTTANREQPAVTSPPAEPTPETLRVEPPLAGRVDAPVAPARTEITPQAVPPTAPQTRLDAGATSSAAATSRRGVVTTPASPNASPTNRGGSTPTSQRERAASSSSQTARLGLAPPLSQTGGSQSAPTPVTPTQVAPAPSAAAPVSAPAAPRTTDPASTPSSRPTDPVPAVPPRATDAPPPAATTDAAPSQQRNVPLIGQRNVPIVRDRNVPIVPDRNAPRTADRTAGASTDAAASRPASTAPPVTPPAAASPAAAPTPPPATPAASPAPAPPASTAAAAPSTAAAAATTPVTPSPPPAGAVARPGAAAAPAAAAVELDRREINGALARYKGAFNALDARAAASVWPTVDRDTLARAFQRLRQQEVAFDDCQIDVKDARASATCSGTLRFVPRVGTSTPQVDRRQWKFALAKVRDEWVIQSVDTR